MQSLLVIDDEPSILHAFQRAFRGEHDLQVLTASSAGEGFETLSRAAQASRWGPRFLMINLPDRSGMETLSTAFARDRPGSTPVIFITGHGTTDTAIEAMKKLRGVRLPAQALGIGPAARRRAARLANQPALAHAGGVIRNRGGVRASRCAHWSLPGDARCLQGHWPRGLARRDRSAF